MMKKAVFAVLLLAALGWQLAAAQEFSLQLNRPIRVAPIGTQAKIYTKISNLTDTELPYSIHREEDLPEQWSSSICFEQCLAPFVSDASSSLDPGETDSFSVWITPTVVEGYGNVTFTVFTGEGEGKQSVDLTFTAITENVNLLVVDPGEADDYESYVETLLPGGEPAATWNSWMSTPSAADLSNFTEVYWLTGDADGRLDADAVDAIGAYLDAGGKVMVSGQNIAYDLCDTMSAYYTHAGNR